MSGSTMEGAHVASGLMCLGAAPLALRRRQVMISGQLLLRGRRLNQKALKQGMANS